MGSSKENRSPSTTNDISSIVQALDRPEELILGPTVLSSSYVGFSGDQENEKQSSCGVCKKVLSRACEQLESDKYEEQPMLSYDLLEVDCSAARGCPDCAVIYSVAKAYDLDDTFELRIKATTYPIPTVRIHNDLGTECFLYRAEGKSSS
jgi:hypothetical protein